MTRRELGGALTILYLVGLVLVGFVRVSQLERSDRTLRGQLTRAQAQLVEEGRNLEVMSSEAASYKHQVDALTARVASCAPMTPPKPRALVGGPFARRFDR